MRTGLVFQLTGASAGAVAQIRNVKADRFRNWWFRSTYATGTYTLDAYATKADAQNQQSRLATATHAAGEVTVTMAVAGGAPWDPTPMSVVLSIGGTWTSAILGWVDDPATHICQRVYDLLTAYKAPNESLETVVQLRIGATVYPDNGLPAVHVMPATESTQDLTNVEQVAEVAFDVVAFISVSDAATAPLILTALCGALRSILCDEQRKLGGMVLDTLKAGPTVFGVEDVGENHFLYRGTIPVRAKVGDMYGAQMAAGSAIGSGGKYMAGL